MAETLTENRMRTYRFVVRGWTASGVEWSGTVIAHGRSVEAAEARVRRVKPDAIRVILDGVQDFCVCFDGYTCSECATFGPLVKVG